jgi:hypothetical protein
VKVLAKPKSSEVSFVVHKVDAKGNIIPESVERQAEENDKVEVQKSPEQMGTQEPKQEKDFISAKIEQFADVPEKYFQNSPLESTLEQDRIKFEQEQAHERTFLEKKPEDAQ